MAPQLPAAVPAPQLRFEPTTFGRLALEAAPLFQAHWEEIARHRDRYQVDLDRDRYLALEREGRLHCVGARIGWGLVGYAIFILSQHLHYRSMRVASCDMIYLAPSARAGGWGYLALVKHCDAELGARGAFVCIHRDKAAHSLEPVFRRAGYATSIERMHEKVLDHGV